MANVVLSFSRVQSYQRCPWLYHLVYNEGWRVGPAGSAALGQSLHKALAQFLNESNKINTLDKLLEIFDEVWVNEGFATPQDTIQAYESGRKMLEQFWKVDRDRNSKVLFTEKDFGFSWNDLHIQGSLDRVDQAIDGTYEIIEYKTRGDQWTKDRIDNDLQMTFYHWGAQEGLGFKPLRLKYYFLSSGDCVVTTRTEEQIQQLQSLIKNITEKVQQQHFEPNHAYCPKCEFGRRCVNFREKTFS